MSKDEDKETSIEIVSKNEDSEELPDESDLSLQSYKEDYNFNVFNAYIICKYKVQIDEPILLLNLQILTYVILVVEWSALIALGQLLRLQSGVRIDSDEEYHMWPINDGSSMTFPFFVIAVFYLVQDMRNTMVDMALITKDQAIDWKNRKEVCFIKACEYILVYPCALYFMWCVVLHTTHDWNGIINTILNLLAYQFIVQLDESVMSFFNAKLRHLLREENAFSGNLPTRLETRINASFILFFFPIFSLLLQAQYSKSYIWLVVGLPLMAIWTIVYFVMRKRMV